LERSVLVQEFARHASRAAEGQVRAGTHSSEKEKKKESVVFHSFFVLLFFFFFFFFFFVSLFLLTTSQKNKDLLILCVIDDEMPAMMAIDMCFRCLEIFKQYFGSASAEVLRKHFAVVYQLMDEVLDNGIPFNTEISLLKEVISFPFFFLFSFFFFFFLFDPSYKLFFIWSGYFSSFFCGRDSFVGAQEECDFAHLGLRHFWSASVVAQKRNQTHAKRNLFGCARTCGCHFGRNGEADFVGSVWRSDGGCCLVGHARSDSGVQKQPRDWRRWIAQLRQIQEMGSRESD
jgi:hypothetical protein